MQRWSVCARIPILMHSFAGSLMLLRTLDQQARLEGGAVYMLNGNHESLNLCGNFRCAPPSTLIVQKEWPGNARICLSKGKTSCGLVSCMAH